MDTGKAIATNAIVLPSLPFGEDALSPIISANTISYHYGKHHKAYVDNLNKIIEGTKFAGLTLEDIITQTFGKTDKQRSSTTQLRPGTTRSIGKAKTGRRWRTSAALTKRIEASFGSLDACKKELLAAATTQFGSGWAWLVQDGSVLKVVKTGKRGDAITAGLNPLLTIDVWEHRVLSGLSEPTCRLRRQDTGEIAQLGFRGIESAGLIVVSIDVDVELSPGFRIVYFGWPSGSPAVASSAGSSYGPATAAATTAAPKKNLRARAPICAQMRTRVLEVGFKKQNRPLGAGYSPCFPELARE